MANRHDTPRVFLRDVTGAGRGILADEEVHHLVRVLRCRAGDPVEGVTDDGTLWRGRLATARSEAWLEDLEPGPVLSLPPTIVLAGILKASRWETLLAQATELGATRLVPIHADHSVAGTREERADRQQERWRRIGDAACKQCRRGVRMQIAPAMELAAAIDEVDPTTPRLWFNELAPLAPWPVAAPLPAVAIAIGPEGGWSDRERQRFDDAGWTACGLGPDTLRSETALAVALAGLRLLRHGLVR